MLGVNQALSHSKDAIGIGRKGTINRPYILKAPFWTVDTLFYAIPKQSVDLYFAYGLFQQIDWTKKDESTGVPSLSKAAINDALVYTPPLQEQQKIASLYSNLDRLITLHQRKYEKLVNLKKAMLDKMFPKNGELVPEVRFSGFSGDWERRKLGDMVQVRTGFPFNSRDFSSDGELLVITNGNIQDESDTVDISSGNRITVDNVKLRGEYELDEHDILVTMDGNVGRTAKVSHHNLILAQRVGRLTARNNREYVYQSLNTGRFTEEMTVMSHGGTIKHISLTEIGGYVLDVPRQTEEQERIGTFLLKLDHLIKLQGRRLEHFLIIKSAFLEKMFV